VTARGPSADPLVAALRCCLLDDGSATAPLERIVRDGGVEDLLERAAEHRVLGALEPQIRQVPGVDPAILERLARQAVGHAAHQLRIIEGLRWFGALMDAEGIPWLTFKGPVVAQLFYRPVVLRTFQDLDLLVHRADFRRAIVALEREGGALLDRNWKLIGREGRAQLHVALPLETEADVHWHVLNRHTIRSSFTLDMQGAFERARTVDVEGIAATTFDAVDTIVHLAVHAALGGADRLSWFDDIRRSILVESPPWDAVIERARSWGAGASWTPRSRSGSCASSTGRASGGPWAHGSKGAGRWTDRIRSATPCRSGLAWSGIGLGRRLERWRIGWRSRSAARCTG
jgi:Uncharacterised nucleotidyltransferase